MRFHAYWAAAILAGLLAAPAHAGSYQLVSDSPTSGTCTTTWTCSDPNSYYSGGSSTISVIGGGASTKAGSITINGSDTWSFQWVPDEGMDLTSDPPVDDVWEVGYNLSAGGGLDQYATQGGGYTANITVASDQDSDGLSFSGNGTPGGYDQWGNSINPTWNGDTGTDNYIATLTLLLQGPNPSVTITVTGTANADFDLDAYLGIGDLFKPRKAPEAIWHVYPLKGHTYKVPGNITPNGGWRGTSGNNYKIGLYFQYPSTMNQKDQPPQAAELGPFPGGGPDQTWSWAAPLPMPGIGNDYESWAFLYRLNADGSKPKTNTKYSRIVFRGDLFGDTPK